MRTSLSEVVSSPTLEAPALFNRSRDVVIEHCVFITLDQALMTECGREEVDMAL